MVGALAESFKVCVTLRAVAHSQYECQNIYLRFFSPFFSSLKLSLVCLSHRALPVVYFNSFAFRSSQFRFSVNFFFPLLRVELWDEQNCETMFCSCVVQFVGSRKPLGTCKLKEEKNKTWKYAVLIGLNIFDNIIRQPHASVVCVCVRVDGA